jgi:hypothetical protein
MTNKTTRVIDDDLTNHVIAIKSSEKTNLFTSIFSFYNGKEEMKAFF